jgi:Domain of unknown function (DUF5667)
MASDTAEIFRQCLQAIEQDHATVDECIARYPDVDGLRDMLEATNLVRGLPRLTMSSPRKAALAQQLTAQIKARKAVAQPRPSRWFHRLLAATAIAIVLLAIGVALLAAAEVSIPGDFLYGLKRASEQVKLSFTSASSQPVVMATIAETRLSELASLTKRGQPLDPAFLTDVTNSLYAAAAAQPDPDVRAALYDQGNNVLQLMAANTPDQVSSLTTALHAVATPTPGIDAVPVVSPTPAAPTLDELLDSLRAKAANCISNKGLYNSLRTKINPKQLRAFINEVRAQSGKKLDAACAALLIDLANQALTQASTP